MSPFTWRLGRLAWAHDRFDQIGGWRRLWWRFWWRGHPPTLQAVLAAPFQTQPENVAKQKTWMHWSPDLTGMPWCGVALTRHTLWTREFEYVTCRACLARGAPMVLQHWTNTR